jgi:hypothetical protein
MERAATSISRVEPEALHDFRLLLRSMGRPGLLRSANLSNSSSGKDHKSSREFFSHYPSGNEQS